jgi:hypothetical protein
MGDLRFDRGPGRSFAELIAKDGDPCPDHIPSWVRPVEPAK